MRPARVLALLGVACAVSGCGGAGGSQQVETTLRQYAQALAAGNTAVLCRRVLAPALIGDLTAAGVSCPAAMRSFIAGMRRPSVSVSGVRVSGASASAVVVTSAGGQPPSTETVHLIATARGWRMTTLASPR